MIIKTMPGKYLKIVSQEIPEIWWNTPQNRWKPTARLELGPMVRDAVKGSIRVVSPACSIALE